MMRGTRTKDNRRRLMHAVQQNAEVAVRAITIGNALGWQLFWANIEIAALCAFASHIHVDRDSYTDPWGDLEKAVHCWPAEVKI